ncbi:MAG: hypothetical protein QGI88_08455, partial [SAR202 cluster bacterium]|nr:hypothetical protein [SAR202 cluster bacterium]
GVGDAEGADDGIGGYRFGRDLDRREGSAKEAAAELISQSSTGQSNYKYYKSYQQDQQNLRVT